MPGGGYIAYMGRNPLNHRKMVNYLLKTNWFNNTTRFLFIDFVGYNAGANLFNIVSLMMEISMTGDIGTSYSVS